MPDEIGTPAEGTAAPETTSSPEAAPAAEPWAPILSRVDELAGSIDTRFAALEQRIPEAEQEPEPDPWASLFGEQEAEQEYEQQQALDPQALQAAFQQALQQANAPLVQQLQQLQQERGREQLLQQIPELKDPEVAQKTIQGMQAYLNESGAPPEVAAWLTNSPQAIAQFYKAAEAENLARGQAPASEQTPVVEAAGGAVPGGNGEPPNPVQALHAGAWQLPPGLR
jgi:hypothetical protein